MSNLINQHADMQVAALTKLVEPLLDTLGFELVLLELVRHNKSRIVRVFIDAPGGIRIEDCALVSRQLSIALAVEDTPVEDVAAADMHTNGLAAILPGDYSLEVSSPGLDRPLVKLAHFRRFLGNRARIVLHAPRHGRRRFTGELVAADDESVQLAVDGERLKLAFTEIETARLAPVF